MPIKRKIRNLPNTNNQMSFFNPAYPNDNNELNEDDLLAESIPRPTVGKGNKDELNETHDTDTITNNDQDLSLEMISPTQIMNRIKQIQNSIEQAQTMLESMKKFENFVPDSDEQHEKLRSLIANLQEQQNSYINLLNLITLTAEERSTITNRNATSQRQTQMNTHDDDDNDLSLRRNVQSSVRPRIESKIGFLPQTINLSDNEQTNRNDNSNYDSLIGSLKSDTINLKDQQSTSNDEESDGENEKEIEKNLMLQKEQFRALQGQKRALIALKRRSEQRLIEQQQQQLINKKSTNVNKTNEENNLLSDINNTRNRLKSLRNLYEQKNSSNKSQKPKENRLKNLEHVRQRLDELEQIVTYYQTDLNNQHNENTLIQLDDTQYLKTFLPQTNNNNVSKQFDKVSSDLAAKRLELEQAKSALAQLQQMVKNIQPDEYSLSTNSTPIQQKSSSKRNSFEQLSTNSINSTPISSQQTQIETPIANKKSSLLSNILSSQQVPQPHSTINNYVDGEMAAQHREIERLIESRQRLHTIKDQIVSLQQTMTTPSIQQKQNLTNEIKIDNKNHPSYRSNQQEYLSQDDNELELCNLQCESDNEEQTDDDKDSPVHLDYYFPSQQKQSHIKQTNLCASENIVTKQDQYSNELSTQMREICHCLSSFIEEQKTFNRNIEQRLTNLTKPSLLQTIDPTINHFQQQTLTQSLIVNLNTAYREIAVLQSEINALQSENNRLTSSISFDNQYYHHHHMPRSYSRDNSKDSIYSFDQIKSNIRPQPRSKFDEQLKQQNQILTTNNLFENSSKTSFNSQSTGKQTAIQVEKIHKDTTPIKQERNVLAKLSTECLSSPKLTYVRSKPISSINDLPNHHDHSIKDDRSKSFSIQRRRSILTDNENNQLYNYKQQQQQQQSSSSSSSTNDYQQIQQDTLKNDNSDDDEQKSNDFSTTIFNIQPSAYYTSITQDLENVDIQTLDLQVKSIMVQLIPFMRLHIDEIFNQSTLNHIRERILFLFKQQPDSAELVRHFQNPFSELIEKTIEKYCGTTIRECAADLIHDISDVAFDELVKYKIYENTNNLQRKNHIDENTELLIKQEDEYSHLYGPSTTYYTQQVSSFDDGENDNKYHIELAESESRPLMLIGSDEEDDDADQEENTDSELETAVSRQETYFNENKSLIPNNLNSNGHEYIVVNGSTNNNMMSENEEQKNDEINNL
ncbi:unnamed protein product [Rotaria sordida]|uniref:Pericentriolar material 1 protein C-terminal domain-containing protein n=1 Tax=Rotaria sordida TaxID=392033 RepID=A0A814IH80_9BILA|nr:unnamed protein product [Rotaria sordida]